MALDRFYRADPERGADSAQRGNSLERAGDRRECGAAATDSAGAD